MVGELTWLFCIWSQMLQLARVATDFSFIQKGKVKKHRKNLWDCFLSSEGRLWKGKVLAPFLSMVFHGLLGTCSSFKLLVCVLCFKKFVLLRDNPCISPQRCDDVVLINCLKMCKCEKFWFEQVPINIYFLEKKIVSVLVSFRQCYPTIEK